MGPLEFDEDFGRMDEFWKVSALLSDAAPPSVTLPQLVADSLCSPASYITDKPFGISSFAYCCRLVPLPFNLGFPLAPGGEGKEKSVLDDKDLVVASEADVCEMVEIFLVTGEVALAMPLTVLFRLFRPGCVWEGMMIKSIG